MNLIHLQVSINRLYPGEESRRKDEGETRWDAFNKAFQPEIHTPESLLDEIAAGHSFCAVISGYRNSDNFVSSQTLALDYDSGNPSIDDLLDDPFIANCASFVYSTLGHTKDNRKWRVVFVTTEPLSDREVYRKAMTALLDRYQMTDQAIKDVGRFLYGSNPHTGTHKFLGNLLPMTEVLKLVSEYDDRRRALEKEVNHRQMPAVDPSIIKGITPDERYVSRALAEELAYLSSRPAGNGERYPSVIPAAMKLESLRMSEWLSPEARAQLDIPGTVLAGCASNGALAKYGEEHLRRAIEWAITHAEARPMPPDWYQASTNGHHPTVSAVSAAEEEAWPNRDPLRDQLSAPSLPVDMIPAPYRQWILDVSHQGCFPPEMVLIPALVGTGAVISRKLGIRPWRFSDYTIPPNLWGSIVARPASMKSFAIDEGLKPLKRLAVTAHDRFQAEDALRSADFFALEAEVKGLKSLLEQAV